MRRIQLGQSTPSIAVVTNGLKEGELVITEGCSGFALARWSRPRRRRPPPPISPAAEHGTSGGGGSSTAGDGQSTPKATR